MCLQCGCGLPYEDFGEPDKNIVVDDIKKAVGSEVAKGITTDEAIKNIVKTWESVNKKDKEYKVDEG
jgi:proline dehydrogenase